MIHHFNRDFVTLDGPEAMDVLAPPFRYRDEEIDSCIDILFDKAVELGEQQNLKRIAAGMKPAPQFHMATNSYHAIEIIRQLEQDLQSTRTSLGEALAIIDATDENRRW